MPARFVIDNSIVMSWCFEDEGNRYAEAVRKNVDTPSHSRKLLHGKPASNP
ncbi:MAG TPA: hypothetical protein PK250_16980 [Syntrophobacter fumaroxidans]|nr:hypothetical protein [Syntrophobacter fumaroxidans]